MFDAVAAPIVILAVVVAVLAVAAVVLVVLTVRRSSRDSGRAEAAAVEAADAARSALDDRERELSGLRDELTQRRQRLDDREDRLTAADADLGETRRRLDVRDEAVSTRERELAEAGQDLEAERVRIAGLNADQARDELLTTVRADAEREAALMAREIEQRSRENADRDARRVLLTAMQRLAADTTTEQTVATVQLPGEDFKGRIIGREGRNIRSFEQITGTNVVIDDGPDTVLVSSFDPVRRETARLAMVELVADGRIHPARIEQAWQTSRREIDQRTRRAADDALLEVGIADLAPELTALLGVLHYRTSYGQNVLAHLIECHRLARMVATELGLDAAACARAAFLHDIGKAVSHETEGSHALIGAELARAHGESEDVAHAIAAHHNEVEPETAEAVLVQVVDALSGSRPGARRATVEQFTKRLSRLEAIAGAHHGVDQVYAMHAGRDIRVMVRPGEVDDDAAAVLARDIVAEIRAELSFPGQISVTVIRESRATATTG